MQIMVMAHRTVNPKKPKLEVVNETKPIDEFKASYGESLLETIDVNTWKSGEDLATVYARMQQEVAEAVEIERRNHSEIRELVFPKLAEGKRKTPDSGLHSFTVEELERAHRGILFNGGIEACDGTIATHDTLALTITQIGVCLVTYRGESGSYAHQIYRRDLRIRSEDPVSEALELLEKRKERKPIGVSGDELSTLAQRAVMAYAERAILLDKSNANWRLGHGNPTPYELLTGYWASRPEMVQYSHELLKRLVLDNKKFIYVPSAPSRVLLQIGQALNPLEYCILYTYEHDLIQLVETGGTRGKIRSDMYEFAREVGSKIAVGLYRVSKHSPPHVFYAHVDNAKMAALIAMADSVLQLHRGFPMLIDIADTICTANFGVGDFASSVKQTYNEVGADNRYSSERETRQ